MITWWNSIIYEEFLIHLPPISFSSFEAQDADCACFNFYYVVSINVRNGKAVTTTVVSFVDNHVTYVSGFLTKGCSYFHKLPILALAY